MVIRELKEKIGIEPFLKAFGGREDCVLLDSGNASFETGRYSYLGIKPLFSAYQYGNRSYLKDRKGVRKLDTNVLAFIKSYLQENKRDEALFPFSGGFVGFVTYDFGWFLDEFRKRFFKESVLRMPLAKFNYYDELFVWDYAEKRPFFLSTKKNPDEHIYLNELNLSRLPENRPIFSGLTSTVNEKSYIRAIEATKRYIAQGDIYQANISQRFNCHFAGDPAIFYLILRQLSPAPFGCFLKGRHFTVICNSPERFLYKNGSYIETRPIKGTRERGKNKRKDTQLIEELRNSEKDKAEHIMIVDLERNDLGKVSVTGSVHVKDFMRIESFANVHHMVSTVAATLREGVDIVDCLYNCFPSGSITGAPKLRSMEIIDELEPVSRGVYCGSIGYIDLSGNADFNVAIRTGVISNGKLHFYVGGGIVADSNPQSEYEETIIKARSFLAAMELAEVAS